MTYPNRLNLKSWAEEDRPREKFSLLGKANLSNAELLAILLQSGNREETAVDLAKRILNTLDQDLNQLAKMQIADLMKFKGIGKAKAIYISAAMELGRRKMLVQQSQKKKITCSKDAFEVLHAKLADLNHEEFWLVLLDKANQVKTTLQISKGGVSGTIADARLIFKPAIEQLASAIILAHNHPSGNLKASKADIQLTEKIKLAAENLDIAVLDHLIIGNNAYYSFADEGLM